MLNSSEKTNETEAPKKEEPVIDSKEKEGEIEKQHTPDVKESENKETTDTKVTEEKPKKHKSKSSKSKKEKKGTNGASETVSTEEGNKQEKEEKGKPEKEETVEKSTDADGALIQDNESGTAQSKRPIASRGRTLTFSSFISGIAGTLRGSRNRSATNATPTPSPSSSSSTVESKAETPSQSSPSSEHATNIVEDLHSKAELQKLVDILKKEKVEDGIFKTIHDLLQFQISLYSSETSSTSSTSSNPTQDLVDAIIKILKEFPSNTNLISGSLPSLKLIKAKNEALRIFREKDGVKELVNILDSDDLVIKSVAFRFIGDSLLLFVSSKDATKEVEENSQVLEFAREFSKCGGISKTIREIKTNEGKHKEDKIEETKEPSESSAEKTKEILANTTSTRNLLLFAVGLLRVLLSIHGFEEEVIKDGVADVLIPLLQATDDLIVRQVAKTIQILATVGISDLYVVLSTDRIRSPRIGEKRCCFTNHKKYGSMV